MFTSLNFMFYSIFILNACPPVSSFTLWYIYLLLHLMLQFKMLLLFFSRKLELFACIVCFDVLYIIDDLLTMFYFGIGLKLFIIFFLLQFKLHAKNTYLQYFFYLFLSYIWILSHSFEFTLHFFFLVLHTFLCVFKAISGLITLVCMKIIYLYFS